MEFMKKYHKWKGVNTFKNMVDFLQDVIVYFDPDVDGMISGYFICKYLNSIGRSYQWYVNSDRKHDWMLNLDKINGKDIIAVDFRITEDKIIDIIKHNCNIISIDHHINQDKFIGKQYKNKKGLVINNQYPFEEEDGRYLSGAGVVFETLVSIDKSFDTLENRALVGLTLLSDVCDIENPLARGYLKDLYEHKMKGYIKYLIEHTLGDVDYGFGVPRLDRKYVDYKFSPAINSCLRFNKEADVVNFFLGSGKLDLGYHKRQKDLVKAMESVANVRDFDNLRVVFVKEWEVQADEDINIISNFIGLIASRFLGSNRSVIAYTIGLDENENKYISRASFRGNVNGLDYLNAINEKVDGIVGIGHPSAFGVVELNPIKEVFSKVDKVCKEVEGNNVQRLNITPTMNLSVFASNEGKKYAEYNMYCLAQHNMYIRYLGDNIKVLKNTPNFQNYKVDGVDVKCFDPNLNFSNGLIYPIYERGYIYYYLQSEN